MMSDRRWLLKGAALTAAAWAMGPEAAMSDGGAPTLDADIAVVGRDLVVRYRVANRSSQPIYVTNKLHRAGAGPVIDADHVYAWIGDGGRLTIAKTMPAIPAGRSPTNLVAPYMTLLEAGESLEETVRLDLPLRPYVEYHDNTPAGGADGSPDLVEASGVSFRLGYFVPPPGAPHRREVQFGKTVDNFRNPPGARARYGEVASPVHAIPVPVVRTRAMQN